MSDRFDSSPPEDRPFEPSGDAWRPPRDARPQPPPRGTFDLARIADALPRLGPVLWIERRDRRGPALRSAARSRGIVLTEHAALSALSRCVAASLHLEVTTHGPRESIAFHDDAGAVQAKLFLLPDTDYLAWDEMIAAHGFAPAAETHERWQPHAAFLRQALARLGAAWRARPIVFETRRLPWLRSLSARPPLRISLLGLELVRAIARSENAELVLPFRDD